MTQPLFQILTFQISPLNRQSLTITSLSLELNLVNLRPNILPRLFHIMRLFPLYFFSMLARLVNNVVISQLALGEVQSRGMPSKHLSILSTLTLMAKPSEADKESPQVKLLSTRATHPNQQLKNLKFQSVLICYSPALYPGLSCGIGQTPIG